MTITLQDQARAEAAATLALAHHRKIRRAALIARVHCDGLLAGAFYIGRARERQAAADPRVVGAIHPRDRGGERCVIAIGKRAMEDPPRPHEHHARERVSLSRLDEAAVEIETLLDALAAVTTATTIEAARDIAREAIVAFENRG